MMASRVHRVRTNFHRTAERVWGAFITRARQERIIHTIQSCLMISAIDIVNHVCRISIQYALVFAFSYRLKWNP